MSDVEFTPLQLDAVDVSRRHVDACVVAGPGSGKTTVLVEYFRRLVSEGVDPLRILAITFTEKAAGNMRSKLAKAFREDPQVRGKLERAWVSTVHGFCARLLKENAVFAGIDPEFSVADVRLSWRMQHEALAEALNELLKEHPEAMKAFIRGLAAWDFEESVLSAYDAMRGAGKRVEELASFAQPEGVNREEITAALAEMKDESRVSWTTSQRDHAALAEEQSWRIVESQGAAAGLREVAAFKATVYPGKVKRNSRANEVLKRLKEELVPALESTLISELYVSERRTLVEILARFDKTYRAEKRRAGLLDFADLEEYAVRLLEEHTDTRARVREQFEHVLMDEFQDTNGQQAKLMRLVRAPGRFYAVGDINQSIFGFRHAEPEEFRHYQDEVEGQGRRVELTDNFRSRPAVLAAVETITHTAAGVVQRDLVARKTFEKPREVCVEIARLPELQDEARWLARRIGELAAEGFEYKKIAVLVRNTEVIGLFTAAFDEAGVPFIVNQGRGFYEAREVNDLTHLLRTIANPRDETSLAVVLRSPLVGVSDESLAWLKQMGDNLGGALMRLGGEDTPAIDAGDLAAMIRFRERLKQWRLRREYVSFDRLLLEAMDDAGYGSQSGSRGAGNIDKFLAQVREASGKMSLDRFVDDLAAYREDNPREADAPPEDSANAVTIMTVHSAKGLEYPVVFVATLHKGVQGDPPIVAFSKDTGLGAQWRNPANGKKADDLYQRVLRADRKQREDEESDRLLYVAMTRAEELLVLSYSGDKKSNWAGDVLSRLGLDLKQERDELVTKVAPDGEEWQLRVVVGGHQDATAPQSEPRPLGSGGITDREVGAVETSEALPPAPLRSRLRTGALSGLQVARPEVREQFDTNATVTALAKFAACPREYLLGNYLGFEGRPRRAGEPGELDAGEFGTQVHELLAGTVLDEPDEEAVRLAQVFRSSPLGRRLVKAKRVEREFGFLMAVEGLVVRGQIDLWFEGGGEVVIVDYKTDSVTAVQAHQRAGDYGLQLRLYATAVERVTGRRVDRAYLHFLRPDTRIEVDLTPSLLESPEQVVREFLEAQETGDFPLRESERCKRCAFYRDLCPAGS